MSNTIRSLILAGACLLFCAPSPAEAQYYRSYYAPRVPYYGHYYSYQNPRIIIPYANVSPWVYPNWGYSGYYYNPGSYYYSYSPFWGPSYTYTNPSYFWYNFR